MKMPNKMTENERKIIEKYSKETPVRLGAIARDLGIEVYRSSLKPNISGLIEPSPTAPSGFRIKINRHESDERQRFTLAHEIGHFILHRYDIGGGVVDNTLYRSNLSSRKEMEANRFAANLIIPLANLREEIGEMGRAISDDTVVALAKKFRVSQQAMSIRLGV